VNGSRQPRRVPAFGLCLDRSRAARGQRATSRRRAIATSIRILIAKVGLDGHDRGAKVVARALRDGGMDVIYTGLHRTPEEVVAAAVQEDVDVLGVSILSGAHMTLLPRIIELLRSSDAADVLVVAGGVIPDEDVSALRDSGVAEVFLQETPPAALVARVRELVKAARAD
jgi:2-hydroxyisobutanoyl-CoA mutase small subunit